METGFGQCPYFRTSGGSGGDAVCFLSSGGRRLSPRAEEVAADGVACSAQSQRNVLVIVDPGAPGSSYHAIFGIRAMSWPLLEFFLK